MLPKCEMILFGFYPQVLEVDSSNAKALYRRAQAWMATGDFVEAELDIRAGLAQVRQGVGPIRKGSVCVCPWSCVATAASAEVAQLAPPANRHTSRAPPTSSCSSQTRPSFG
jgi:hypothetical protein